MGVVVPVDRSAVSTREEGTKSGPVGRRPRRVPRLFPVPRLTVTVLTETADDRGPSDPTASFNGQRPKRGPGTRRARGTRLYLYKIIGLL